MSWSPNQIATVGAQASRFPAHQVQHWIALRAAPENIRALLTSTNASMSAAENDANLSPTGKQSKCAEIARDAVAALDLLAQAPAREAARRIEALNQKASSTIAKPENDSVATAIRAHVAAQKSPALFALARVNDPATVSAILAGPSYLSNLTEEDVALIRAKVVGTTKEAAEIGQIESALGVVSAAVVSAKAMIGARSGASTAPNLDQLRAAATAKAS